MSTITLVACVSKKLDRPAPAADLYVSPWFKKARQYAELTSDRWFILSAKYGLVEPARVIEPYEVTLNRMNQHERFAWADKVYWEFMGQVGNWRGTVVILAGEKYRLDLARWLRNKFTIEMPLLGLGIGQQLAWFEERIQALTPTLSQGEREQERRRYAFLTGRKWRKGDI